MAKRILFLGYGNPGRLDDGLGPVFVSELLKRRLAGVDAEADYQLMVEDSALLPQYDTVFFVDADESGPEPYGVVPVREEERVSFTTHSVGPGSVLALARALFGRVPEAYMLSIRGYEFNEFGETLSTGAQANLLQALDFAERFVREREAVRQPSN